MNTRLSALLSAALLDRAGGHRKQVLRRFCDLKDFDLLEEPVRAKFVNDELAGLLNYARERVPHCKTLLLGAGAVGPANALSVLKTLPVLVRPIIQLEDRRLVADGATNLIEDATGGSTGTPMRFWVDRETQRAREASMMWSDHLAGWEPGSKIAMLWGSDRDVSLSLRNSRLLLRWWVENRRWYNAFDMGEPRMLAFDRSMTAFKPALIVAYAGSIFQLARFLKAEKKLPSYPSCSIVSSAECLTADMRAEVESVFRKPVFDRYGNREFGAIAAECEAHDGLHVNERDCLVEIESADPERIPGRLIVTYFPNRAMPFLRYDTGDLACFAPRGTCRCGRSTRRLTRIEGRVSDIIRTASGRLIHGEYFTHLMYQSEGVREFQFVQETLLYYRLLVEGDRDAIARQADAWRQKIASEVGVDARVDIEPVESIPALASGKRRFTLSKLQPDTTSKENVTRNQP